MEEKERAARENFARVFRKTAVHWRCVGFLMTAIHVFCGVSAIFLSITVASKPSWFADGNSALWSNLAYLSACFSGLLTFLSAKQSGIRHTHGYRVLARSIDRFMDDPNFKESQLEAALEREEKLIQTHTF
jgi:hypothetical protein